MKVFILAMMIVVAGSANAELTATGKDASQLKEAVLAIGAETQNQNGVSFLSVSKVECRESTNPLTRTCQLVDELN